MTKDSLETYRLFGEQVNIEDYLKDIAKVPLLAHEQEITLGRQVQELMQVEKLELELIDITGEKLSIEELAEKLNLNPVQIKKSLTAGQRAKERMVAANLRLVVSVAKRYTKKYGIIRSYLRRNNWSCQRGREI